MKNRLREVRYRTNLTLSSASRLLGINSDTLAKYERGEREPKLKTSIRDVKVGVEWKYGFTPQVSLSDQTLIKNRDSGLEEALEFVTRHDVVDMNSFKEADGGMTIEFIYRKSK